MFMYCVYDNFGSWVDSEKQFRFIFLFIQSLFGNQKSSGTADLPFLSFVSVARCSGTCPVSVSEFKGRKIRSTEQGMGRFGHFLAI